MTNPLLWMLCGAGLCAILWRRFPVLAWASAMFVLANVILVLPPVTFGLVRMWEAEFSHLPECQLQAPEAIVLLPGGVRRAEDSPAFSRLTLNSHLRLERALALSASRGQVPILVSGIGPETRAIRQVAAAWGQDQLLVDLAGGKNTNDAAAAAAAHELLQLQSVWLVTSALHMRRSLAAFQYQGATICPYPVDFTQSWMGFIPDFRSVRRADALLHEVVGLIYYRVGYLLD